MEEYYYKEFNNDKEITDFFDKLNKEAYFPIHWNKQDDLNIYGCFYADYIGSCLFVYGRTIRRYEITENLKRTIFDDLKVYGSSRKYKGLLNFKGEVVLNNIYDDISIFYQIHNTLFLKTMKNNRCGLVCSKTYRDELTEIIPTKYEELFYAGEYTIGFVSKQKVGFMSLEGKIIVEPQYKQEENYNKFINGKALVCIDEEHCIDYYINHYGDFIDYPETENMSLLEGKGTSTYPYGDLPDASDAYEGLLDAFWNTD